MLNTILVISVFLSKSLSYNLFSSTISKEFKFLPYLVTLFFKNIKTNKTMNSSSPSFYISLSPNGTSSKSAISAFCFPLDLIPLLTQVYCLFIFFPKYLRAELYLFILKMSKEPTHSYETEMVGLVWISLKMSAGGNGSDLLKPTVKPIEKNKLYSLICYFSQACDIGVNTQ